MGLHQENSLTEPLVPSMEDQSDENYQYAEYYQPGVNDIPTVMDTNNNPPTQFYPQNDQTQPLYPPIGIDPQLLSIPQYSNTQQMPPIQQVYIPAHQPIATSIPSDMIIDEHGRMVMKAPTNMIAWIFVIIGLCFLWFPFLGLAFLIFGLLSRKTDIVFDDRKRELISVSYGALIKFKCLDFQVSVPYSSINDVVTEMDFTLKLNRIPNGKIFAITSSGNVKLSKGYTDYYLATEKAKRIMTLINQRKIQY